MDKKLGGLLVIFFLLASLFITTIVFNKQVLRFIRASEEVVPSVRSSLLFAYPLLLKADGASKSTINVFIRSEKGIPIKNQRVLVTSSLGTVDVPDSVTNEQGKVTYQLTSTEVGVAEIEALINGSEKIAQKLSIKFE